MAEFDKTGFQRDEYDINGVRTVVYSAGQGRPVVYFHGGGTFHGIDFARAWTDRCRVILPFHPGWGESADAPHLDCMNDYLLHYRDLFERLGLDRFDLVGSSIGGRMAAEFAIAHGHLLRKLVLLAPAGLAMAEFPMADLASIPPHEVFSYLVNDLSALEPYLPKNDEEAAEFAAARAREAQSVARIAARDHVTPKLGMWLHRATVPTLLIWGKADRLLPYQWAQKWLDLLPNARLELLDDVGHLILDESEQARQVIAGFLV